jgi:FKBP-type peptidyl-prolyl cis-trans isomerase FkpA
MRYSSLAVIIIAAAGFTSCKHGGYTTTKSGLQYDIHTSKGGKKPKVGDYIKIHYVMKTDKDSVVQSSYDPKGQMQGKPIPVPFAKPQRLSDLMEGFAMLGEGDSATFRINSDSLFSSPAQRPPFIKAGEFVKFVVKLEKIETQEQFMKEMETMKAEMMKKMEGMKAEQAKKDDDSWQAYFKENNIKAEKTASGLYYTIEKAGTGDNVKAGDTAYVNYAGMLTDGKVFDSNIEDVLKKNKIDRPGPFKPLDVPVGQHRVIPGWDEGLTLFKKGGKGKLFIPSVMAYGPQGSPPVIPGNSNLVFTVEIVNVKAPKK